MLKRYLLLVSILCPISIYAQFGVKGTYLFDKSETLESVDFTEDGFQVSLEYSFRLKQKRIEFHPGLGYRFAPNSDGFDGSFTGLDFDFNTAIYPFDFDGDCDCPTWSKDGTLIKKGFFIEISPGLSYQTLHRNKLLSGVDIDPISTSDFVFKIGASVGLDIGISEQLTLTPILSYTRLSSKNWNGLLGDGSAGNFDDQAYLGTGLRLVYKPDPKRRRRF